MKEADCKTMNYIESLQNKQICKVAPYWKRFLSTIIDVAIIYGFYWIVIFSRPHLIPYVHFMTFVFAILYLYMFYSKMTDSRTIGAMIMKIKPFIIEEISDKNKVYFYMAILKASLFVPSLSKISILLYAGTIIASLMLLKKNEAFRKNNVLLWDYMSKTIVVEDGK